MFHLDSHPLQSLLGNHQIPSHSCFIPAPFLLIPGIPAHSGPFLDSCGLSYTLPSPIDSRWTPHSPPGFHGVQMESRWNPLEYDKSRIWTQSPPVIWVFLNKEIRHKQKFDRFRVLMMWSIFWWQVSFLGKIPISQVPKSVASKNVFCVFLNKERRYWCNSNWFRVQLMWPTFVIYRTSITKHFFLIRKFFKKVFFDRCSINNKCRLHQLDPESVWITSIPSFLIEKNTK